MIKKICKAAAFVFLLLMVPQVSASAMSAEGTPYSTYQYDLSGEAVKTPHAYIPQEVVSGQGLGTKAFREPTDIKADREGNLYICDTGNNRIVVVGPGLGLVKIIDRFDNEGRADALKSPAGIFVTDDGGLFVADLENRRILEFDPQFRLVRSIERPTNELLPSDYNFAPSAVAVDRGGRIYAISQETIYGIMVFGSDGNFEGFIGAQKVTPSLYELFWRNLSTKAQRERSARIVPINYTNIAIDREGFVYATSIYTDQTAVAGAIFSRSKESTYAMVKKFNPSGEDVLTRNGYYPPAGDIAVNLLQPEDTTDRSLIGTSEMIGIALHADGMYSLADAKKEKIFTYDAQGNLLYAFGGAGYQKGLFQKIGGVCYRGTDLYAVDTGLGTVTRFVRTDYGKLLWDTIGLGQNRRYSEMAEGWNRVLEMNANAGLAYAGMGNAVLKSKDYKQAMEYFKMARDVEGYSKAFGLYRKELLGGYFLLVPLGLAAAAALLMGFFRFARRYNRASAQSGGLKSQLMYSVHLVFRPFDGFWDLKNERRGGIKGAAVIFLLAVFSILAKTLTQGFIFSPGEPGAGGLLSLTAVLFSALVLFCVANWCVTSLMDGKGKLKDIFICVCYSLTPLVFLSIPAGILSNMLTLGESGFITLLVAAGYLWTGILLFFGTMVTHQYSLSKNVASTILTLAGIVLIVFIGFLLVTLFNRIFAFVGNIILELSLRK